MITPTPAWKNPKVLGLVALVGAILIIGGGIYWAAMRDSPPPPPQEKTSTATETPIEEDECQANPQAPLRCEAEAVLSAYETQLHRTLQDCWIILKDPHYPNDRLVYDLSLGSDTDDQPGYVYDGIGDLADICGFDATDRFQQDQAPYPSSIYMIGYFQIEPEPRSADPDSLESPAETPRNDE